MALGNVWAVFSILLCSAPVGLRLPSEMWAPPRFAACMCVDAIMGLLIGLLSELVEVESLQHQAGLRIVLCLRGDALKFARVPYCTRG